MARGIEKALVFKSDYDRDHFLERLGDILIETQTACYAWALLPNHFHLLIRTANCPVSTIIQRLLTGYAVWFNKRHNRHGHLFQNRFKSILCQEEPYFLELVRYIHLNPLRASLVIDLAGLDRFAYCGHSAIMGKLSRPWQTSGKVLEHFGKKLSAARRAYMGFIEKGIVVGRRDDLVGGGLVRSAGGWQALKALRKIGVFQKGDERILGDGDFVQNVLVSAQESMEREYYLRSLGFTIDKVAQRVADLMELPLEDVWAPGRYRHIVEARSLLSYWAVRELRTSMASLSRRLNLSVTTISKSVKRGELLALENNYQLIETK